MKNRRLLSILLSVVMVLSSVTFAIPASAADTAVYYVDQTSGSDTSDGKTASTAYATIETAIAAINASTAAEGTIVLTSDYTCTKDSLPAYTKMITFTGDTTNDVVENFAIQYYLSGPTTIDNVNLSCVAWDGNIGKYFYAEPHELVIGENVTFGTDSSPLSVYATANSQTITTPINLTINSGVFDLVHVGQRAPTEYALGVNGANVKLDGGSGTLYIGSTNYKNYAMWFNAPVNIEINGGDWGITLYDNYNRPVFTQGFQLILNNGETLVGDAIANEDLTLNVSNSSNYWSSDVRYIMKCAAGGGTLSATDTLGTFAVNGSYLATATDGTNTYTSVGGKLSVPAGEYDVTFTAVEDSWSWEDEADATEAYFYVSAAGSDSNDGLSADKPWASLANAVLALDALSERFTTREVRIVGDYTLSSFTAHSNMITYTGADNSASLAIESDYPGLNGPTTFENIVLSNSSSYTVVTDGNELVLGEGLSYKTTALGWLIGSISKNTGHENVTIKSGDHSTIWLGTHGYTIDGITLTLEGGSSTGLWYGSLGTWANGAVFTDSIDIVYNGGSFGTSSRYPTYKTDPVYAGVQLILNNGNSATAPAGLGTNVFSVSSSDADGSALAPTDTIGEYTVIGGKIAKAENSNGKAYYSHDGKVAVPAGTYTVTYLTETEAADEIVTITFDGEALEGTYFKGETIKLPALENTMDKEFAGWQYGDDVYAAGASFTLPTDVNEVAFTSIWSSVTGVAYRYVDAVNGNDSSNSGTSSSSAYKTIGKAIADLEEYDDSYSTRKVLIVGTYTLSGTMDAYTSMITISGAAGNSSVFAFSELTLGGPTTFENITLRDTAQWKSLYTNEHELVWGKSVEVDTTNGYTFGVHLANIDKDAQSELKFTMNGGSLESVAVGTSYNTEQREVPGATVTINDGNTKIYFGEYKGWNDEGVGVLYTEDVNVVFNGGTSTLSYYKPNAGKNPVFDKGFHLIMNNGTNYGTIDNATEGRYNGGKWEMFSAAGSAGSLAPSGETGKFKVVGENVAARAQSRTTGFVYFSDADGYLTVPADYYDVSYITNYRQGSVCRFVDAVNGSDSNDGTTLANAYATIGAAIADLDALEGSYSYREVRIVGEYTLDAAIPTHENMITILGNTGADTDTITVTSGNIAGGPIAYDNITISASVEVTAENADISFGENVVFDFTSFFHLGMNKEGSDKAYNLVLDGGNFGGYVVAGPRYLAGEAEVAGANIEISSGTGTIILGSKNTTTSPKQNVHYTAPVNITLNVDGWNLYSYGYARLPYFDAGVQVIANNGADYELQQGMPDVFADSAYFDGGKWEIYSAATEGCSLEATDKLGIYKVNGDLTAVATNKDTGAVYASSEGVLSVPAGVYNVTYTENEYFTNDGNTLTVNNAVTVDFASIPHDETVGRVFLGWTDELGAYVENGTLLEADTVLYAQYKTIDALYTDSSDKADFGIKGAQVRIPLDETTVQGLRFVAEKSNLLGRTVEATEFGAVLLPTVVAGEDSLVLGGKYTYKYEEYEAACVPAAKIYKTLGDRVYYTVVVTGLTNEKLDRDYTVRGYVKYTDGNGVEQVLYTDSYSTSTLEVAEWALENDTGITEEETAVMQKIRENSYTRTDYSDYIAYRTSLSNTYKKLTTGDKTINVVYLGGSVTHGTGASVGDRTSWRALSGFYLKEMFPDANINLYNAAIGESGTHLGTFRLERDIMPLKPDLFILEYAINDSYHLGMDDEVNAPIKAASMYETIVRELRTAYPEVDIFGLVVADKIHINNYPDTNLFNTARGHVAMAEHYGISLLNVGLAAQKKVDLVNNWDVYFGDNAHPNDRGYYEYYKCVEEFLYNQLVNPYTVDTYAKNEIVKHEMAAMKSDSLLDGNRATATAAQLAGVEENNSTTQLVETTFEYVDEVFKHVSDETRDYVGYYEATSTDQYITFTFSGTEFALYTQSYSRNGTENLSVSIDGGDFVDIALTNYNPSPVLENLDPAVHTVTIRPTFSSGTYTSLKIGVIYSRDDSLATTNPNLAE